MKYKVICSDLDGTLLNSDSELSDENALAISRLADMGYLFVPSSGRTVGEIPASVLRVPSVKYIIYSNGAGILDRSSGESFAVQRLFGPSLEKTLAILAKYDVFIIAHNAMNMYIDKAKIEEHEKFGFSKAYYKIFAEHGNIVDDVIAYVLGAESLESMCVAFADMDERGLCICELDAIDGISVTSSGFGSIEIMHKDAGKGKGLVRFAEFIGIPADEFIAIGDSHNDIEMIEAAGLGIAVSNANSDVLASADKVICSNEEHIMKYILDNIDEL